MSLILEALRKSEAERRRGQPPDLLHELPPAPGAQRRRLPAWGWALAAAAVIALLWWLWPATSAPAPAPPTIAQSDDPGGTDAPPQTMPAPQPSPAPAAGLPAPSTAEAPDLPAPAPATPSAIVAPAASVSGNAPDADAAAATQIAPIPAATPPADVVRVPTATPTALRDAAPPSAGGIAALSDLDADTRRALPPLKISMHMWNEEPARRFAIVDGRRVVEGDRVGEATVTRIEPDGVLLEWRGSSVRVPLR